MTTVKPPVVGSNGSALCTQCGLCCTGALHDFAVLEPEETAFARRIGMTLRTEDRPGFALPCPFLANSCCTIYADRPKVCARYKCALLESLEAGTSTLPAALDKVATAKELLGRAASLMPDGMTVPIARSINEAPPASEGDADRRSSQLHLRLAMTSLSLFLDQHFRKSSEGALLLVETIADAPDPETK